VHDRVDLGQVRERLREVPEVAPGVRVDLLGVQQQRAGQRQQLLAQRAGACHLADLGERRDQPEGADRERALLTAEPVLGFRDAVAQYQFVLGELVRDRQHRRAHPRIVGRQEPDQRYEQQGRIERGGLVVLAEHTPLVGSVRADVRVNLVGRQLPVRGPLLVAAQPGELRAAIGGHPAHDLGGGEVPGRAPHLPQPLVGAGPVLERRFHLPDHHRPAPLIQPVP
jgi:hypothetical protein